MEDPKLGKYEHYKGKFYEVIAVGRHSETLEELVVYKALYDSEKYGPDSIWIRPKSMFCEEVDVDGKMSPVFFKMMSCPCRTLYSPGRTMEPFLFLVK